MGSDQTNDALFWSIAGLHAFAGLFAIYRMARSAPVPLARQGPSTTTAAHPSGSAIESIQQYTQEETITQWSDDEKTPR